MAALAADPGGLTLQFRLIDQFGDNGIVSVDGADAGRAEPARSRSTTG